MLSHSSVDDHLAQRRAFSRAAAMRAERPTPECAASHASSVEHARRGARSCSGSCAHRREQRRADDSSAPTGPRAAGSGGRRGCGWCPRRARRSGRSRTATRRSGSAWRRRRRAAVAAAAAAGSARASTPARIRRGSGAVRPRPGSAGVGPARRRRGCRSPAEHPGVLRAAALAGVDDQRALGQRDPGQPAGQHPDVVAVVDRERAQVDVPRRDRVADQRRDGRQLHHRLRDPAARVGEQPLAQRVELAAARPAGRSRAPCRPSRRPA